jgi:hypothetical protein
MVVARGAHRALWFSLRREAQAMPLCCWSVTETECGVSSRMVRPEWGSKTHDPVFGPALPPFKCMRFIVTMMGKTGRFLLPLVVRDGAGNVSARNAYSDDAGVTWHVGESPGQGTDQSKAVELETGVVLQNFRDGPTRVVGHSRDGGITFYDVRHDPVLIDSGCNAGLTLDTRSGKNILIFTNAASHDRRNLTVRFSFDNGQSWRYSRVLFAGPAAYSTVASLRDGTIAVLYERGDVSSTERITFARFNLAWVTSNAHKQ